MPSILPNVLFYLACCIGILFLVALVARLVFRSYFEEKQKYLKRSLGLTGQENPKERK